MSAMTPKGLRRRIRLLPAELPLTKSYERKLASRGVWRSDGVWYKSQKEHWLGWLAEYDGPGAYNRKTHRGRSAEFAYNHINCPPMLLYLAEAVSVPKATLLAATRSAFSARRPRAGHCAAIRKMIPWAEIEQRL